jgi:uncharacterized protein VirK/YbjX
MAKARSGTALGRLTAGPGRVRTLAAQPFVCAKWSSAVRLRRMIEHCAIVDKLSHPFDIGSGQYVEFLSFELDGHQCRFMLDQPKWRECDGLLSFSLWVAIDRVFTISICLSDDEAGRTAYVGGIQGRKSDEALDQNRALTKAAHGMRPRDLAFELFRMLIPSLGVTRLKCVADANRYHMTRRAFLTIDAKDKVLLNYDEIWEDRGGVPGDDGFFVLPTAFSQRDISDVPAKKRSMYRRRYAMLDQLSTGIGIALKSDLPILVHRESSNAGSREQ